MNNYEFESKLYQQQLDIWSNAALDKKYWNDTKLVKRSMWLADELKKIEFESIYEIGMGCGRNLFYIYNALPHVKMGGNDININALAFAKSVLPDNCLVDYAEVTKVNVDTKFDVVFTHNVLMHLPCNYINITINKCIEKANKYIIHIEKEGPEYFYKGPEAVNPAIVSNELLWAPNLEDMYKARRDCNVVTNKDIEIFDGCIVRLVVIEKL